MIRMDEWLFSKVPFMLIPLLIFYRSQSTTARPTAVVVASYLVYLFFFFSFGYAINDYSDRENDRLVGKVNIMANLPEPCCCLIIAFLIAGCLPFLMLYFNWQAILLFFFIYFWGAAYSVKPFRFKVRGFAGLLVSSLAQRTFVLFPLVLIDKRIGLNVAVWGTVGFLVGMRYIVIHQILDFENDKKGGIKTFVGDHQGLSSIWIVVLLVLECILLAVFFALNFSSAWWLLFFVPYLFQNLFTFYAVHYLYKQRYLASFICVPLEDFYNFYFPLLLLAALMRNTPAWGILFVLVLAVGWRPMVGKWKIMIFGITHFKG